MSEKLSKNFSRDEFACNGTGCCGHSAPISLELVDALQRLHRVVTLRVGKTVSLKINSGFRCKTHNAKVKGAVDSPHCKGIAADVATPAGLTDVEFFECAKKVPEFMTGGMGIYNGRIHVDVRKTGGDGVKWDNR